MTLIMITNCGTSNHEPLLPGSTTLTKPPPVVATTDLVGGIEEMWCMGDTPGQR